MRRPSERFTPSGWSRWLVPFLLGVLLLALLATLGIIILSVMGLL